VTSLSSRKGVVRAVPQWPARAGFGRTSGRSVGPGSDLSRSPRRMQPMYCEGDRAR
jgi:hypothetical protein